MKRLVLFTLLFVTFALTIALPKLALSEESPAIEKATLERGDLTDERYLYVFDFDFVNALQQPIEIISVNVFDVNGHRLEQEWAISGRNWDPRLMTHALSGDHPLVKIISKPRGTLLEQATITSVGDRIEIKVTNRVLSAGAAISPSLYLLSSKNKYDSLVLRVAYRMNGNMQEVSRRFIVGMPEQETVSGAQSRCPGAPFVFPIPSIDSRGNTTFIGWLYKEPTFGWPNTTPDNSSHHSGLDFWASPGTPVMAQAAGTIVKVETGHSGTLKPTIKYPDITYVGNDGRQTKGDVYVYTDNLVSGKIGNEEINISNKFDSGYSSVSAGSVIGFVGEAYAFAIKGQQHIHWSISPKPGTDQNPIPNAESEALQLDPTSFLTPAGKSLNARGQRTWITETLSWWCTSG